MTQTIFELPKVSGRRPQTIPLCRLQCPAKCDHKLKAAYDTWAVCDASTLDEAVRACPYREVMELMPTLKPGAVPEHGGAEE